MLNAECYAKTRPQVLQNPALPMGNTNIILDQKRQAMNQQEKTRYETGPTLGSVESMLHIPMRDGHQSETRVFKPGTGTPSRGSSPLVALLFGGGFTAGSNLQLVPIARALVSLYGAVVVTLSYRLAPDHKFPTAPRDTWDNVQWLARHAPAELGADLAAGFVLGGVSAGGNLAVVTAHQALKHSESESKHKLAAPLTGLWTSIPITLSQGTIPAEHRDLWLSREQNATAPLLGAKQIEAMHRIYEPDFTSDEYTPFSAQTIRSFAGMPPTYVQVAGLDPLRDDGLVYERALRGHGVQTRLDVYPGMPHGHFAAFPGVKASDRFRRDTVVGIGWLLGREVDGDVLQ